MNVAWNARIVMQSLGCFHLVLGMRKRLCLGIRGLQCGWMTERAHVCVAFELSLPWSALV